MRRFLSQFLFIPVLIVAAVALWIGKTSTRSGPERAATEASRRVANIPTDCVRRALLVGVDDYAKFADLRYAVADVELIREKLLNLGFKPENIVELKTGVDPEFKPSKANIEERLNALFKDSGSNDAIFIAFSGHGFEIDGVAGFAPEDARLSGNASVVDFASTISITDVIKRLKMSPSKFKWLVVDACRENPTLTKSASNESHALKPLDAPPGIVVLQSCGPTEFSFEDKKSEHGLFTSKLAEALDGKADFNDDGKLTILEVVQYATEQTIAAAKNDFNGSQTPYFTANITDFVLTDGLKRDNLTKESRRKGESLLTEADVAVKNGDFDTALTKIDEALKLSPTGETFERWTEKRTEVESTKKKEAERRAEIVELKRQKKDAERRALDPTSLVANRPTIPDFTYPVNEVRISTTEELKEALGKLRKEENGGDRNFDNTTLVLAKGKYELSEPFCIENKTFAICGETGSSEDVAVVFTKDDKSWFSLIGKSVAAFVGIDFSGSGDNMSPGLACGGDARVAVRDCRLRGAAVGLACCNNAIVDAEDCEIANGKICDVYVCNSGRLEMRNCRICDSRGSGVDLCDAATANVSDCDICNNAGIGVDCDNGGLQSATFRDNRLFGNKYGAWNDVAVKVVTRIGNVPNWPTIPDFDYPTNQVCVSTTEELTAALNKLQREENGGGDPNFNDATIVLAKGTYLLSGDWAVENKNFAICGETTNAEDVRIVLIGDSALRVRGESVAAFVGLDISGESEAFNIGLLGGGEARVAARSCRIRDVLWGLIVCDNASIDAENCEIANCGMFSVFAKDSSFIDMRLCKVVGCKADGVVLADSATANVSDCDICDNDGFGVAANQGVGQSGAFRNNRLFGNKRGDWDDGAIKRLTRIDYAPVWPAISGFAYPTEQIRVSNSMALEDALKKLTDQIYPNLDSVTLVLAKGEYELSGSYSIKSKNFAICGETGNAKDVRVISKGGGIAVGRRGVAAFVGLDLISNDANANVGLTFDDEARIALRACRFREFRVGLRIGGDAVVDAEDCEATNCKQGVVICNRARLEMRRCKIREAKADGIYLRDSATANVSDCDVCDNGGYGVCVDGGEKNQAGTFRNNRLFGNKSGDWNEDALARLTRIDDESRKSRVEIGGLKGADDEKNSAEETRTNVKNLARTRARESAESNSSSNEPDWPTIPNFAYPTKQVRISTSEELNAALEKLSGDSEFDNVTLVLARGRYELSDSCVVADKTFAICGETGKAEDVRVAFSKKEGNIVIVAGNGVAAFVGLEILGNVDVKNGVAAFDELEILGKDDAEDANESKFPEMSGGLIAGDKTRVVARACRIRQFLIGLAAFTDANVDAEGCQIVNCGLGVGVNNSSRLEMRRCKIYDCVRNGISVQEAATANVSDCEICDNGGAGVGATEGETRAGTFSNNRLSGNKGGAWSDDALKRLTRVGNTPNE